VFWYLPARRTRLWQAGVVRKRLQEKLLGYYYAGIKSKNIILNVLESLLITVGAGEQARLFDQVLLV
jgi:hypothetical protein